MTQSVDEKRGYAKGYAAGKKFADHARSNAAKARAENRFWQQVFCAALTGTLQSPGWKSGDKNWSSPADYARGCGKIADEALRQHKFRS